MKFLKYFLFSLFCLSSYLAKAQPQNNDCESAINIPDIADWCSTPGQFTNVGATPSGYDGATCFGSAQNDVWFKFTAIATDVTAIVNGAKSQGAGGTLRNPQIVLYRGTCGGTLNEQECVIDNNNINLVELYKGGLTVGETYLIRVQGGGGTTGSFQLCLNNYNPPVNPGSDCVTAAVLCDKSPFVVQSVVGAGNDPDEAGSSSCLGSFGGNSESNSTWFVWTADDKEPGTLTFTLSPTNPSDDLDFVLYELPDGIGNCNTKSEMRCMASGDFVFPSPCMGPTGLREGETDFSEPASCFDPRQNSFLAPIDMESGKSYALLINNYSSAGNGFAIEFGGSGKFQGPEANILADTADAVCYGRAVFFEDASTFPLGNLTGWEWSFGVGAEPATATGLGPHEVVYNSVGEKSVVLTVETDLGCIVTEIETFTVGCCEGVNDMTVTPTIVDALCPDIADGAISLEVESNAPPYSFLWEDGTTNNAITNLIPGDYMVTITNDATCDTVLTYTVATADPIVLDTLIGMPTCDGGVDGSITLNITSGVPPFEFNWNDGNGFIQDNNSITNIPIGVYDVSIRDGNGCILDLSIFVNELVLELDPSVEAITPPSCFGGDDGSIVLNITNGLRPYEFDFGNGFSTVNSTSGLAAGTYRVLIRDANNCRGDSTFVIEDHPPLEVAIEGINVSCFGAGDGSAIAHATGGVGDYIFTWNDGQTDSTATDLVPGDYTVTVRDGNGCETMETITITEPGELFLEVTNIQNVLCNSIPTGEVSVLATGGNPPFEYSVDGILFQEVPVFSSLAAGDYTFIVRDEMGCTNEVDATVTEPPPLTVDAGPDQRVDLGFTTVINTFTTPPLRPVTYQWTSSDSLTLSCTDCPNPVATPANATLYQITITDETGCTATDEVLIEVFKNRPIYFPNVFSPNSDGINDYFTGFSGPAASEIKTLRIFNRWGALVFEANNIPLNQETLGWDGLYRGKKVEPGVYAFYAEITFIDDVVLLYKGDVTIQR